MMSFEVQHVKGSMVWVGVKPLSRKISCSLSLEMVQFSAFLMQNVCNGTILSPQTEQICFVFQLGEGRVHLPPR